MNDRTAIAWKNR